MIYYEDSCLPIYTQAAVPGLDAETMLCVGLRR